MDIKEEVRVLNSSVELIRSFVNYSVCSFPDDRTKVITTVLPNDHIAKKYFFILLLDVIAGVNKEMVRSKSDGDSLLDLLHKISLDSKLSDDLTKTKALNSATTKFISWLNHEFEYEIYSANIGLNIKISLSRREAIYLIGNRCKHSLVRSNNILCKLLKIYKDGGVVINPGTESLILDDIDTWLFDDFGGYHFTKLCELSANVYYGVMQYIYPVREQCLEKSAGILYSYKIPAALVDDESKFEFYALLNEARSPFIPAIKTCPSLEKKY